MLYMKRRQRVWVNGNFSSYTFYCGKASKLCRGARSPIILLTQCNPKKWWNKKSNNLPVSTIMIGSSWVMNWLSTWLNCSAMLLSKWPHRSQKNTYIISPSDVYNALICINVQKTPGPDEIPNWLFKSNANTLCSPIASIFNSSIREGKVPPLWKLANVL